MVRRKEPGIVDHDVQLALASRQHGRQRIDAIQFGKVRLEGLDRTATVSATGSGDAQLDIIRTYGATAINYRTETVADYVAAQTGGVGFDVVFDTVGGGNMTNAFEAAALNGHVSSTVSLLELDLSPVHFKGLSLHVVFMLIPMLHDVGRGTHGAILTALARLVDAGAVTPLLDDTSFTLDQVGDAHARLTSGQAIGKVVIDIV